MRDRLGDMAPRAFGAAGDIGVQRALTEVRAGRPVFIRTAEETVLALAIDGAGPEHIAAFADLCRPGRPRLAITARRARALGLDAAEPVLIDLAPADDAETIFALAA